MAHGLGTAESLVTLSKLPVTSERAISHLINLAPCPIPTYFDHDDADRRLLSKVEAPRELSSEESFEIIDEKEGRLLRASRTAGNTETGTPGRTQHRDRSELFWERTERYCTRYPDNCTENFSSWYPHKYEEFC